MAQTKEQLVELIEAYAAAKVSSNAILITLAAGALQQILSGVTFADYQASKSTADDFTVPDDMPSSATRRVRKESD